MKFDMDNPFSIVKASDYSDEEINTFWVDMPGGDGFASVVKPLSTMPMILLGGKGSGKTHLMRHFSYPLQKIRHGSAIKDGVRSDGYLGIYLRCGALNTDRFSGKQIQDDVWAGLFSFYLEIWLCRILIDIIIDIGLEDISEQEERTICVEIYDCFDKVPPQNAHSLRALSEVLSNLQKSIDLQVNNCIYDNKITIEILCGPGKLVFGVPEILSKYVPYLSSVVFNYLIDELEHFDKPKQKYLNTLIRDKRHPTSVKCGVRTYGMKTFETLADAEENIEGHEYELMRLDDELRNTVDYLAFAKRLCASRLEKSGIVSPRAVEADDIDGYFSKPKKIDELCDIEGIESGRTGRPVVRLSEKLRKNLLQISSLGVQNSAHIDTICDLLSFKNQPVLEKSALHLFYKSWSTRSNLLESAKSINIRINRYRKDPASDKKLKELIAHHKTDYVAQLRKEYKKKQIYSGFESLASISVGFPRHLLTILKYSYQESVFNGENPFRGGQITIGAQIEGVRQASQWFFDESRVSGPDGVVLKDAVARIAELFRINRYSDKPTESSLIAFYCEISKVSGETRRLLDLARQWSLLIKDTRGRKDKNSGSPSEKYILNPMLSPHWGLPIGIRGVIKFDASMLDAIFDTHSDEFEKYRDDFETSRNAPFRSKVDYRQGTLL